MKCESCRYICADTGISGKQPEFRDYVPFMERVVETWLAAAPPGRELIAVPELGPLRIGYRLHGFPSSWEDAKVLRDQTDKSWHRVLKQWRLPK